MLNINEMDVRVRKAGYSSSFGREYFDYAQHQYCDKQPAQLPLVDMRERLLPEFTTMEGACLR